MRIVILMAVTIFWEVNLSAQEFEYVYSQYAESTMNDAVRLGDKIIVAANIEGCSKAGFLVFDTLGNLLGEQILYDYFSVSSALALHEESNQVFLLSYTNESEELYDTTRFYLHTVDTAGNWKLMRSGNALEFGRGSLFVNDFAIVFDDASQLVFVYPDLGSLATKDFSDVFGDRYISVLQAGEDFVVFPDGSDNIDTVLLYQGHPLFAGDQVNVFPLTNSAIRLFAMDSLLLAMGEDNVLRSYNINTGLCDSLHVESDFLDLQFSKVGDQVYMLLKDDDNFTFRPVQAQPLAIGDPLWSVEEKVHHWRILAGKKYLTLLSSLVFSDHSYRQMSFATIRRMLPSSFSERSEYDIAISDLEILDSLTYGTCKELNCEFEREAPAIAKVTIRNVGSLPIENFAFYGKSLGGSFCVSFRTNSFNEVDLMPGETFVLFDSIYPVGVVRDIDYYAHVQIPNHRLERDTTNNFLQAELFTTPTIDLSFESLDIFPNPTSDYLHISGLAPIGSKQLRIYQFSGQLIRELTWTNQPILIADLFPGMYLVQLQDDAHMLSARFVKQ